MTINQSQANIEVMENLCEQVGRSVYKAQAHGSWQQRAMFTFSDSALLSPKYNSKTLDVKNIFYS